MQLRQFLFDIGRRLGKRPIASRLFCFTEKLLPLHRLDRSQHCVAFCHPRPVYEPHVLIVPTVTFPFLADPGISNARKSVLLWEMIGLARDVTADHDERWRIIINGGERQEIGQVHGHLIHDDQAPSQYSVALIDPEIQSGCWEHVFEWIRRAHDVPGNGYSVIVRLNDGENISASFQERASY